MNNKQRAARDPSGVLICDGCKRCFHAACCKKKGISTKHYLEGALTICLSVSIIRHLLSYTEDSR